MDQGPVLALGLGRGLELVLVLVPGLGLEPVPAEQEELQKDPDRLEPPDYFPAWCPALQPLWI